jgi:catechol 2,3-dioxygenase-like lactoylglutathione lyase family enzyme
MIHHVTLKIGPSQVAECVRFYAIFGFRTVEVPTGIAGRAAWLERDAGPHQQIHLMFDDASRPAPGHFALVCPQYEATLQALRSAGHEIERRAEHWGSPRAYVRDPGQNLVEMMQRPPEPGRWTAEAPRESPE